MPKERYAVGMGGGRTTGATERASTFESDAAHRLVLLDHGS
jgi:hypothetical protein